MRNLDGLKGHEIEVRIIKLNKKRGNIVVSRKQLLEEEQSEKRTKTLEQLEEGAILTGTVKNLTDYGAFVDLGGIDGLLHITDMSWGRLDPSARPGAGGRSDPGEGAEVRSRTSSASRWASSSSRLIRGSTPRSAIPLARMSAAA